MCASYLMLRCASLKVDAALSVGRSGLGSTLYYQELGKGSVAVAWRGSMVKQGPACCVLKQLRVKWCGGRVGQVPCVQPSSVCDALTSMLPVMQQNIVGVPGHCQCPLSSGEQQPSLSVMAQACVSRDATSQSVMRADCGNAGLSELSWPADGATVRVSPILVGAPCVVHVS
jgi:hypothetical protein